MPHDQKTDHNTQITSSGYVLVDTFVWIYDFGIFYAHNFSQRCGTLTCSDERRFTSDLVTLHVDQEMNLLSSL